MRDLLIAGGIVAPLLLGGVAVAQQTQQTPEPRLEGVDENQPVEVQVVPQEGEQPAEAAPEAPMPEAGTVQVAPQGDAEAQPLSAEAERAIVRQQAPNELRVDWITGATVRSPEDENIGSVQDLILDQDSGQITAAIVSVGGFLGIGAKQIAVDFSEMQIDYDAQQIMLNLTRDEAEAAPEYAFRDREAAPLPEGADPALQTQPGLTPTAPDTEVPRAPSQ